MTEYDVKGFKDWLSGRYCRTTVNKYLRVIVKAEEHHVSFDKLKSFDASQIYALINGKSACRPSGVREYKSSVLSYEHFLDYKERNK